MIFIFYKSEIVNSGQFREYYTKYYLISLFLVFYAIFIFFQGSKFLIYNLIILPSVLISFYIFQVFHIQFNKYLLSKKYYEKTGKEFDFREIYEIYEDLLNRGEKISVWVPPKYFTKRKKIDLHPLSSISNVQTINCNENGYFSKYVSDRYGFNNPDEVWENKKTDYLIIGDSFARGECVNRGYDIASLLRNLSKRNVITLGFSSNGPLTELATLREYTPKDTKKIIWLFHEGSDLKDLQLELKNEILKRYIEDIKFSQNLKTKQNEIDEIIYNIIEKKKKIHKKKTEGIFNDNFKRFITLYHLRKLFFENRKSNFDLSPGNEFNEILKLVKNFANSKNIDLYFVYLPDFARYDINLPSNNIEIIKNMAKKNKIKFLSIHDAVFKNMQDPKNLFPFGKNGHYNDKGYELVSKAIYQFVK